MRLLGGLQSENFEARLVVAVLQCNTMSWSAASLFPHAAAAPRTGHMHAFTDVAPRPRAHYKALPAV